MNNTSPLGPRGDKETNNSSDSGQEAGLYDFTTGIVVNALLLPLIVGGNSLVIAACATNRRLRSGTYLFLVSLAISDLLVGSVALPMRIYGSLKEWQVSLYLTAFYNAFDIFSAVASNLHLIAISFERFIAVSRPFYYQMLSARPYVFASLASWCSAGFVAAIHPNNYLQSGGDVQLKKKIMKIYMVLLFAACFVGPLLVVCTVNIGIFRVAKAVIRRTPQQQANDEFKRQIHRERKTAVTLILMSSFFFVAWFPFFVVNILYLYCVECLPPERQAQFLIVDTIKWLHYSNSAVNPAIYAFRDTEMRESFAKLVGPFRRTCCLSRVLPDFQNTQNTFDMQFRRPSCIR